MDIKDLKTGDVLLFSPEEGSFISWAITFLTNAPVSHAAIFFNDENKTIIEESPPQVKVSAAADRFAGREIYVRRLNAGEGLPLLPVINAATGYLNQEEPYDMSGLYLVGLLLLYKKFSATTWVQKVMIKILKKLTASINDYIQKHKNPGKTPMVCSQFVTQCYDDAGQDYKLKIKGGVLQKTLAMHANGNTVLDQVLQVVESGETKNIQTLLSATTMSQDISSSTAEELCKELQEAFEAATVKTLKAEETTTETADELVEAVSQFSQAHYLFSTGEGGTKLNNVLQENIATPLLYLKSNENMFVSPGDLLNHCENLKDVGRIK